MTTDNLSRARANTVDDRVIEVAERMVDGRWRPGPSHREMAKKYGCSIANVEDWATDAGRFLRLSQRVDRDELRARNQARLDHVYAMALERQTVVYSGRGEDREAEVVPQPDLKAAVSALAEQGKLLGLNAPEKVQVSAGGDYDALTDEAKLSWVDERIAELQDERVRLVARMRIVEVKT